MDQAGEASGHHGYPKSHRLHEVLRVGFSNLGQMFGQWIHQRAEWFFQR